MSDDINICALNNYECYGNNLLVLLQVLLKVFHVFTACISVTMAYRIGIGYCGIGM